MKVDKLLAGLADHLDGDEEVLAHVMGQYETKIMGSDSVRAGVLAATQRRIVFYAKKLTGFEFESFPYDRLSSFEQGKNMMGPLIRFHASGNDVTVKWISKGNIDELVAEVRAGMADKGSTGLAPANIPQQIGELAQLRDVGAITEEEFDAKKRDLLDRM